MADNVAVTAGSGTTIAADEVVDATLGTVKVQYVKLMDGTLDGSTKAAVGANGLAADVKAVVPGTGATNLGKAEDAAHASGDTGVMALAVRADTAAATAGTDGDYQPLITDASGRLHTNVAPLNSAPAWSNIGANNTDGVASTSITNFRWGHLNLSGTWSATVQVQVSGDGGTTWVALPVKNASPAANSGFVATSITANGNYFFALPGTGLIRIRTTAYSSGSVVGSVLLTSLISGDLMPLIAIGNGANSADGASLNPQGIINYAGSSAQLATPVFLYNNSTWDRQRGINALTLLSSAARTVTLNSSDQINYNWHGLLLTVDVSSAGTGSITPSIQIKDSISGNYKTIWTAAAAITTAGTFVYALAPNVAAASYLEAVQLLLSRTWRLTMTHNNANSITYSASADMML